MAVGLATGLGCSVGAPTDNATPEPTPWMPDSGADQATGDESGARSSSGSATDGGEATTSGAADTGGDSASATTGSPTTTPPMESTDDGVDTADDDGGTQPASGWWAHCTRASGTCDPGLSCLLTDVGDDGVCTSDCVPSGDPRSCGASPGGTTNPVCLTVAGGSICALGCEGGLTCPGGMVCIAETDDLGPISICV